MRNGVFESMYGVLMDVTIYAKCSGSCNATYTARFTGVEQCERILPVQWPATPAPAPFAPIATGILPRAVFSVGTTAFCPGDVIRIWADPSSSATLIWDVRTGSVGSAAWTAGPSVRKQEMRDAMRFLKFRRETRKIC